VRSTEEYEKEHIADSVNIPMADLPEGLKKFKDKTKPIIVVCASGQRAKTAAKSLSKEGFEDVYVLSGGIHAWKEAKLPLFG
jgi:rhodanese-related sulfurtransferase